MMAKHDIRADMQAEGESLKQERSEPKSEDVREAATPSQYAMPRKRKIAFMDVPGSDPSAVMKGDKAQTVRGSTTPGASVKKPARVGKGGYVGGKSQFALPRERRPK